jgi:hypothetical protein
MRKEIRLEQMIAATTTADEKIAKELGSTHILSKSLTQLNRKMYL